MHTNNIIAHTAPDPTPPAGGQEKMIAKGLRSTWGQPNTVDKDMFTSPQKKYNAASNQFATSDMLYGGKEERK